MPRGVRGSGPKQAPKKQPTVQKATATASQVPPPEPDRPSSPLAPLKQAPLGSLDVDSLSGDELRAYARRAGVLPRDVDHLSEDRLRQNTKLTIANHFELLAEA